MYNESYTTDSIFVSGVPLPGAFGYGSLQMTPPIVGYRSLNLLM